jgi:cytochrome c oxidase subunit 2
MTDLGIKRDAIPGFINESWTRINRAGTYYGQCSKLCGINHAYMPIVVVAVPEKEFDNWIIQQKTPPAPSTAATLSTTVPPPVAEKTVTQPITPSAPSPAAPTQTAATKFTLAEAMQRGEKTYLGTCAVCHKPDGTGMPPTFPPLKGSKIATGPREAHINQVLNGKPGTAMQAFRDQLNDEEIAAVITYERNAFGNNTGDLVQPDDIKTFKDKEKK